MLELQQGQNTGSPANGTSLTFSPDRLKFSPDTLLDAYHCDLIPREMQLHGKRLATCTTLVVVHLPIRGGLHSLRMFAFTQ
eukprot:3612573-Amphidinium_carterae.1